MALQLDLDTTPIGVPMTGVYARIVKFSGTKDTVSAVVAFYTNKQASDAGAQEVDRQRYIVDLPVGDIMPGLYGALKKLPEFDQAVDV